MLIPGIRYEKVNFNYDGNNIETPQDLRDYNWEEGFDYFRQNSSRYNEHWLPNVHVKILPTSWMDIRLAYTNTISRPDYSEILPSSINYPYRFPMEYYVGNPDLEPQFSENWDANISVYSNDIGLASVCYFHKKIENLLWWRRSCSLPTPDEAVKAGLDESFRGYNYFRTVNNPFTAYLDGIELEWQTKSMVSPLSVKRNGIKCKLFLHKFRDSLSLSNNNSASGISPAPACSKRYNLLRTYNRAAGTCIEHFNRI